MSLKKNLMNNILSVIFGLLFSICSYGQVSNLDRTISHQDSILLHNFWTDFNNAIKNNDKSKLATICEFPISCSPCTNDTTLKINDHNAINVTKKLFYESQYKVFFNNPMRAEIIKQRTFNAYLFHPTFNEQNKRIGFNFSYSIVAPSKTWDGLQGFIYLDKKNGKYKITGIDTVP
jgi:hypothetical protein